MKRGQCEGRVGLATLASLFRRDPQFGSQCHSLSYPMFQDITTQNTSKDWICGKCFWEGNTNVSFLQNIYSSRASYLMSYLHKCKNTEAVFTSDYINILHTICSLTDCFRGHQLSLDYLNNSTASSHNLHLLVFYWAVSSSEEQLYKWKKEKSATLCKHTQIHAQKDPSSKRSWGPCIGWKCGCSNFWWKPIEFGSFWRITVGDLISNEQYMGADIRYRITWLSWGWVFKLNVLELISRKVFGASANNNDTSKIIIWTWWGRRKQMICKIQHLSILFTCLVTKQILLPHWADELLSQQMICYRLFSPKKGLLVEVFCSCVWSTHNSISAVLQPWNSILACAWQFAQIKFAQAVVKWIVC